MVLTEKERDLIETIRNMRRSYPNGRENGWYYIQELISEMLDPDSEL